MSDTRAVVFHNSYATVTETSDNASASRHIRQGTHIDSLSFALHDASHAINAASVVSVCGARRLVGQS